MIEIFDLLGEYNGGGVGVHDRAGGAAGGGRDEGGLGQVILKAQDSCMKGIHIRLLKT